jgi:hypothetical protein
MNVKKLFDLKGRNLTDVPHEMKLERKTRRRKCALPLLV